MCNLLHAGLPRRSARPRRVGKNCLFSVAGVPVPLTNGVFFTIGLNTLQITYNAPEGGSNFSKEYFGGLGSFVNITVVPEPTGQLAVLIGLGTLMTLRRRSRR
jgi:hypothetical protein